MSFIGDFTDDDWHYTINNELHLIFYVTTEAWPHLVKNGGVIINTASVQGRSGLRPRRPGAHGNKSCGERHDPADGH